MKPAVVAVIQARMTSSRLPGKVLQEIAGKPALKLMCERVARARLVDKICVCVPDTPDNAGLFEFVSNELSLPCIAGSESDVLSRFIDVVAEFPADYYVRLTADCPLICPEIIDIVIATGLEAGADYASNVDPPSFPDGMDVEMVSKCALVWAGHNAKRSDEREHVTLAIRDSASSGSQFKKVNVARQGDSTAWMRLTLDYPEDLLALNSVTSRLAGNPVAAGLSEIESTYLRFDVAQINGRYSRAMEPGLTR